MKGKLKITNQIIKMSRKGFRGYPVATVAYYGPDNHKATKVAVGIVTKDGGHTDILHRWYAGEADARLDTQITKEILAFIKEHRAVSVASVGKILGCPHEEAIDYPVGESCPQCPYWAGRDRWAGLIESDSNGS